MAETTTFKCAMCATTFDSAWTEIEAEAELQQLWGDIPEEMCLVICDDCWKKDERPQSGWSRFKLLKTTEGNKC